MSRIPVGHGLRDFPGDRVSLRQRERNRTDSHKQEQIRSASNEMRFDSRINLFFHVGSLVKRSLSLFWLWTPYLLQKTIEKCQYKFRDCSRRSAPRRITAGHSSADVNERVSSMPADRRREPVFAQSSNVSLMHRRSPTTRSR